MTESQKNSRLAGFVGNLLLDGYGLQTSINSGHRDRHPYFGKWPFNIGDHFVGVALGKILNFDEFYSINWDADDKAFDIINNECDYFIYRGQNCIYPGFFEKNLPLSLLKKIKIPFIHIGTGIQYSSDDDNMKLTAGDVNSLKYIHDSCVSCGVRGIRTQNLLNKYGINNVRVIGCPTLFWSLSPTMKVRHSSWKDVGWTVTEMGQGTDRHLAQMKWIDQLSKKADKLTVFTQGGEVVLQEYILCRDGHVIHTREDQFISEKLILSKLNRKSLSKLENTVRWYYRSGSQKSIDSIVKHSFFSHNFVDYMKSMKEKSLIVGTRLHGGIMALSQGTPMILVWHDARTKEMADYMGIPNFNMMDMNVDLELEKVNWDNFNMRYPKMYRDLVDFFNENGITHNLQLKEEKNIS